LIGRAARVALAATALALASAQARTWWAEQAYEEGLGLPDPRTGETAAGALRDVPGRLHAYEVACARDPDEPLYAVRAGQIEQSRAVRTPVGPERAVHLRSAREHLERAARLQPLDAATQETLAQVLTYERDLPGALRRTRSAVLTGPATRPCSTRRRGASPGPGPDARSGRPRRAVDAARLGLDLADGRDPALPRLGRVPGVQATAALLRSSAAPTQDDLLSALGGRPDLLRTAARLVEDVRPEDAAALRRRAEAQE